MNQPVVGVPQMLPAQVIDTSTDSREILRHAKIAARRRKLQDWFVVDVDAHHVETVSWNEVVQYIEDPVIRDQALLLPPGPHRRAALRAQRRPRPALPERRRPHPAPGRPAREGRGHQRASRRDADPPRHGFARRRQHGGVPDADAVPRPASAARDGGLAVARLQQVDAGEAAVGGRPHQVPGRAAVQHAGGVRAHRQGDRRQEGHHRLRRALDAARAGAPQQVHAALPHDRGDRHADLLPCRLSLGRSLAEDRQPVPRHARAGLRLAQHRALHELDPERHPGPLPQAQGDVDRVRASPGRRS